MSHPSSGPCRIAMIGYGIIGQEIERVAASMAHAVDLVVIMSRTPTRRERPAHLSSLSEVLAFSPDIVIECASQRALAELGPPVLSAGFSLVASSIGALADRGVEGALANASEEGGGRLHTPGGALVGIDGLAAARRVGLGDVLYRGLSNSYGAPTAQASAGEAEMIFAGSARDACQRHPKHANVAAAVAIAGLGFEHTRVELVSDPALKQNRHEIYASGAFGTFQIEIMGRPIRHTGGSSVLVVGSLLETALSAFERSRSELRQ